MAVVDLRKSLPILVLLIVLASFSAHANGSIMDQFERSVGAGAVADLVKAYGGEYHLPVWEKQWVDAVFERLVQVTARKDVLTYSLTVLNSMEANAFALPGGFIFITRGLLRELQGDSHRLAAVLGHELAHVELKHGINTVLRHLGLTVLVEMGMFWLDVASSEVVRMASATVLQLIRLGWGRDAEFEADLLGQELAYAAGFDPAGAVMLMDYLISIESDDHSVSIFSTHPASAERRSRMAGRVGQFWSKPVKNTENLPMKVAGNGRNSDPNPRMDFMGRFVVELVSGANGSLLKVYDKQLNQELNWLPDKNVLEAEWSPDGRYLAVVVEDMGRQSILLLDRYGRIAHDWRQFQGARVSTLRWDPSGKRLAYVLNDGGNIKLIVGYVPDRVDVPLALGATITDLVWSDDGDELYFFDGRDWFEIHGPSQEPVVIVNPVPRVVERRSFFSPTVERDGNTIRLTRPQLTIP